MLEDTGGPILCTQPRRLAVVAVASRVAQERDVPLGGSEVGYHVGQANHSLSNTKLLFTTAGILLQELRANSVDALSKFKVVVIDECHERSPESDLVLVLVKNLLLKHANKNIRIILMSATFDHGRYVKYFHGVPGCEHVETITLETASSFETYYSRVETHYLEDIFQMLPDAANHLTFARDMKRDPDLDLNNGDGGKTLSSDMLVLMRALITYLNDSEPVEGVFVVFAPTYRHLEQVHHLLVFKDSPWEVGVLHSSVDMEFCLRSMQQTNGTIQKRKILLASAIADSSVTIPGVTCIIDLCRALQVKWDASKRTYIPKTIWASKSVCEQRKGRTGRTCAGRVFRLLPQGFFINRLPSWDVPQLCLSSCRDEVLKLLCTGSALEPDKLLSTCLDPPGPNIVSDAMGYLESIGACVKGKKKFSPTTLGELMASLPFLVEDSHMIIKGGQLGLFLETLTLRSIFSHKPSPIVHHFGQTKLNEDLLRMFHPKVELQNHTSINIAHLSAFFFWDAAWNGGRLRDVVQQFGKISDTDGEIEDHGELPSLNFSNEVPASGSIAASDCKVWKWTPTLEHKHSEWCREHHINPTAVRAIAELIVTSWNVFYLARFEPEWLRSTDPIPKWRLLISSSSDSSETTTKRLQTDMLQLVYKNQATDLEKVLTALSERAKETDALAMRYHRLQNTPAAQVAPELPVACIHFLQGNCKFGASCRHSHSKYAVPPPCKYFQRGECLRGDTCVYSHVLPSDAAAADVCPPANGTSKSTQSIDPLNSMIPINDDLKMPNTKEWFSEHAEGLLLLGEGTYEFAKSLNSLGFAASYASTPGSTVDMLGDYTCCMDLDATRMHLDELTRDLVDDEEIESFFWNFPFSGVEENDELNESLILGTFLSISKLLHLCEGPQGCKFAFTLQGDQFARWSVLRSALRSGWRLVSWGDFNPNDYPNYKPKRENGEPFPGSGHKFYEFRHIYPSTSTYRIDYTGFGKVDEDSSTTMTPSEKKWREVSTATPK